MYPIASTTAGAEQATNTTFDATGKESITGLSNNKQHAISRSFLPESFKHLQLKDLKAPDPQLVIEDQTTDMDGKKVPNDLLKPCSGRISDTIASPIPEENETERTVRFLSDTATGEGVKL